MSYEVNVVDEFKKDVKKLFKKYKSIKGDILELIEVLEEDYSVGIHLGNDLYKIRVKNSDVGGKSGGYRVIYYTKLSNNSVYLLTIYSKTQKENIDVKILQPIIDKLNKVVDGEG
ncbi:MAG: Toxin-antitoxin system, toxin component, RelE family [uncultured Sulfurovum sp.]|uniref:Toxin-antitoxin system, toxin component, RelE family n=1 Tax=uncultured Sulfurovum sp. TaxID=269237 RepID=A0A6S6SBQ1_9BACT|nr:MAG: Toxin-antitoxin system, toxin component, RelE family [uncultured Sulfurovum sp.]